MAKVRNPIMRVIRGNGNTAVCKCNTVAYDNNLCEPGSFIEIKLANGNTGFGKVTSQETRTLISEKDILEEIYKAEDGEDSTIVIKDQLIRIATIEIDAELSSTISSFFGQIDPLTMVYVAKKENIKRILKNNTDGLPLGEIMSGNKKTGLTAKLTTRAMSDHWLLCGQTGSGKTNLWKCLIYEMALKEKADRHGILAIGHPDLVKDNLSEGTIGLMSYGFPHIKALGYNSDIKLHPSEIASDPKLKDLEALEDWSPSQWQIIKHAHETDPDGFISNLAWYDDVADPYNMWPAPVGEPADGSVKKKTHKFDKRSLPTISRIFQKLNRMFDPKVKPLLDRIINALINKETIFLNLYDCTAEETRIIITLLLHKLQKRGMDNMDKRKVGRNLFLIDEFHAFAQHLGQEFSLFSKQCRKSQLTLGVGVQNIMDRTISNDVKGEFHNIFAFYMNKDNVNKLVGSNPDLEGIRDVLQTRPVGETTGQMVMLTKVHPWPITIRTPRFEDIAEDYVPADGAGIEVEEDPDAIFTDEEMNNAGISIEDEALSTDIDIDSEPEFVPDDTVDVPDLIGEAIDIEVDDINTEELEDALTDEEEDVLDQLISVDEEDDDDDLNQTG
jgi:hypothetical protein